MTESQKVEQVWETPPLDEIPKLSKAHVEVMEQSDDDAIWKQAGMDHVLLRTVGRKSGNEHKVALPMWRDPDGRPVVVASFAGAKDHPSWYLNFSRPHRRTPRSCVACKAASSTGPTPRSSTATSTTGFGSSSTRIAPGTRTTSRRPTGAYPSCDSRKPAPPEAQWGVSPPSAMTTWPVTKLAASDARNKAGPTISSGSAARRM